MKHRHPMPFGAETRGDGTTRFRLWAPGAARVELVLSAPLRAELPMAALAHGWYESVRADAPPGTRYAYRIDGASTVPDPASRANPEDVHAPSLVVDPLAFEWQDDGWRGGPWEQAVLYELHVGTFTPAGTFAAAMEKLDALAELGVTALELMPLAEFPGRRNWGYDGVLPFAPEATYGTPEDLKRLVQAAHARGLMVLLDVVYNHFGPEGNYLHLYAPQFFDPRRRTPWGAALDFDGPQSRTVREFFVHNALYWLEEYRFDGLRLDAVHAIRDRSSPDIVEEIAARVRAERGRERHLHLVLENDRNEARYLERDAAGAPRLASAQWNDDLHHAAHVLLTGERGGYYADYADAPLARLGRALAEGFVYQGEASPYRGGAPRGEPSAHLPASAFVSFLQTHDQVGNRALGQRLHALCDPRHERAALACLLLAPQVPMLFMGEEWAASTPFLFFCDFGPGLAETVAQGRRREFARFPDFGGPEARARIPDPGAVATFEASKLRWEERERAPHRERRELVRALLAARRRHLARRLRGAKGGLVSILNGVLRVQWWLGDGTRLRLLAHFGAEPAKLPPPVAGETVWSEGVSAAADASLMLEPGAVHALVSPPDA